MRNVVMAATAGFAAAVFSTGAMAGKDLDAIKARGSLVCGVGTGTAGFGCTVAMTGFGGTAGATGLACAAR